MTAHHVLLCLWTALSNNGHNRDNLVWTHYFLAGGDELPHCGLRLGRRGLHLLQSHLPAGEVESARTRVQLLSLLTVLSLFLLLLVLAYVCVIPDMNNMHVHNVCFFF